MSGSSSDGEASSSLASSNDGSIEIAPVPEGVPGVAPRLTMAGSGATSGPRIVEAEGAAVGKEYLEDLGKDFRVPFSSQGVNLAALVREFNLPDQFEYLLPRESDSACTPPPGYITVYTHMLKAGFRLPPLSFQAAFIKEWDALPCLLLPNAWRVLNAFELVCTDLVIRPCLRIFRKMHKCIRCKSGGYSFASKTGMGWVQTPSSTHPEKEVFFYVKPRHKDWEFRTHWRRSRLPFTSDAPTQQEMITINLIRDYAARVGTNCKLVATTYCSAARLNDLALKVASICE